MNTKKTIRYLITNLGEVLKQIILIKNGVPILLTLLLRMVKRDIIALHDRSIVASITDKHISTALAKETLQKAIDFQLGINTRRLMLHSDQGSRYTSKEFIEYCTDLGITQSMNKAGYLYDNAPMERYFNTLKNELINLHRYHTEKELYAAIEEFAYTQYNHVRPHSYNNYRTPFEARYGA